MVGRGVHEGSERAARRETCRVLGGNRCNVLSAVNRSNCPCNIPMGFTISNGGVCFRYTAGSKLGLGGIRCDGGISFYAIRGGEVSNTGLASGCRDTVIFNAVTGSNGGGGENLRLVIRGCTPRFVRDKGEYVRGSNDVANICRVAVRGVANGRGG